MGQIYVTDTRNSRIQILEIMNWLFTGCGLQMKIILEYNGQIEL
jgi:hypothetical protein